MIQRVQADHLITMDGAGTIHSPGVLDHQDGMVIWSGPASEADARPDTTALRLPGVVMPGLVDIHCHTPMVILRGAGEGLPVDRWLHEVMWPREAKLTAEDVQSAMTLGASELLANGITTSVEMYFHGEAVARGAVAAGLRSIVTAPIIEDPKLEGFGDWRSQLDEMIAMRDRWTGSELIEIGVGPHSAWSTSEECLRTVTESAIEYDMLVHIHVAEQEWEDAMMRERSGMSAPTYLEHIGILEGRVLAAHCVWMSDHDIAIFGQHRVGAAHCPCSNTKHASGIARLEDLRAAGIRVGIATDGPASHHRLDLFEEMRLAMRLARIKAMDSSVLTPGEVLAMTTRDAADAVGRTDLGRLTPGARADFIHLSLDQPAFHPVVEGEDDLVSRVVWSGAPEAVRAVWVGGRQVVAQGTATTVDVPHLVADITKRAGRLAG